MTTSLTVIGTGFMGEKHAHAVHEHPTLTLESVVDLDDERARTVANRYGADDTSTDFEAALDRADAAVIASPEAHHAEQALAALDRGVHVLVEKPLTVTLDNARRLADRARATDVVSATGFLLRYDPAYARAAQSAADGELGEIVGARAKRTITVAEVDRLGERGHPLYYTGIHDIDLLNRSLAGRVSTVSAVERRGSHTVDIPDAIHALLTYDGGTIATLEGYSVLPEDTPNTPDTALELTGTEGYAAVETPGDVLTVHTDRYDHPDTRHWPVLEGRIEGAVRRQMDRFADAIDGRDEMSASIGDGYRAQVVADAIDRATGSSDPIEVEWER